MRFCVKPHFFFVLMSIVYEQCMDELCMDELPEIDYQVLYEREIEKNRKLSAKLDRFKGKIE